MTDKPNTREYEIHRTAVEPVAVVVVETTGKDFDADALEVGFQGPASTWVWLPTTVLDAAATTTAGRRARVQFLCDAAAVGRTGRVDLFALLVQDQARWVIPAGRLVIT